MASGSALVLDRAHYQRSATVVLPQMLSAELKPSELFLTLVIRCVDSSCGT